MKLLLFAVCLLCGGSLLSFLCSRKPRAATAVGVAGIFSACAAGLLFCLQFACRNCLQDFSAVSQSLRICDLRFDLPQLLFLPPLFLLTPACALHAVHYVRERQGYFWGFFQLLTASIILVPLIPFHYPVAFLVVWEMMGLTSFALVSFDFRKEETARAAWRYLLSAEAGALCLILCFIQLSLNVTQPINPCFVFLLAVAGFGLKSGLAFLHFWLPPAHAAAPAPISALMSGAMNNMGIYGIFAMALFLRDLGYEVSAPMGWTLVLLGGIGALGGILFALAQTHLKRLIAYSSVENFGIMAMGLGVFLLGFVWGNGTLQMLGLFAAILHMYNHTFLKGLLFLCAGALHLSVHTYQMDQLGGLLKKLPRTGAAFLFGAIGISGLPPLNAFLSEFLLYAAAVLCIFNATSGAQIVLAVFLLLVLSLLGGIAIATFTKAFGTIFLGAPRTAHSEPVRRTPVCTVAALFYLMFCSVATAVATIFAGDFLRCFGMPLGGILLRINLFGGALTVLFLILLFLRRCLPSRKYNTTGPTWDCGYEKPTARMQYTGASFSLPLEKLFKPLLSPREWLRLPTRFFPEDAARYMTTEDAAERRIWQPLFRGAIWLSRKAHRLQSGYLHLYVLFMVLSIAFMLVWAFLDFPKGL